MPPSVQWSCVAGFGPNISWCGASCALSSSSTMPGSTTQVLAPGSTETTLRQYLDQSMTTATLHACPARLVPPPRDTTGAPKLPAYGHRLHPAVYAARDHDADRHLAVVRRVGAVGAAAARVEPDLAVDPLTQGSLERPDVDPRWPGAADDRIRQGHPGHDGLLCICLPPGGQRLPRPGALMPRRCRCVPRPRGAGLAAASSRSRGRCRRRGCRNADQPSARSPVAPSCSSAWPLSSPVNIRIESSTEWNSCAATSTNDIATAAHDLRCRGSSRGVLHAGQQRDAPMPARTARQERAPGDAEVRVVRVRARRPSDRSSGSAHHGQRGHRRCRRAGSRPG